jgi:hypothetical protein
MSEELEDDRHLYRATIRAMPDNPAGRRSGVQTGLWYVAIFKRRGLCVENEDYVRTVESDLTWDEALQLSSRLNRNFAGERAA